MTRYGFVLVAAATLCGLVPRPAAQVTPGRLSAAVVSGAPVITLDVPANDLTAFEAARAVLQVARVPHGLESGALPADKPPIDFARPPDRTIILTGLTVGKALDAIAQANPNVRWTESDGLIVVRTVPDGEGLLDRRLPRFVIVDASPRHGIEALVRWLDPNRPSGFGIAGMGRPAAGRMGEPPTRQGKDVSLALDNPTVLDVLNGIARANGAMSWQVRYSRAPASYETATITFTESGETVTVQPPDAVRALPSGAAGGPGSGSSVPVTGDIASMLTIYVRQSGTAVGVEQVPAGQGPSRLIRGVPAIDLSGLPPAAAIARIVAFDSRYEWSASNDRFLVRPKADVLSRPTVLDKPIPSFVRVAEPLDTVLGDLVGRLDVRSSSQTFTPGSSAAQQAGQVSLEAARMKLIDVRLPGATTVREALDAICRAAGSLSWVFRPGSPSGQSSFQLQLQSNEGWTLGRSFTLSAPLTPLVPLGNPGRTVPAALEREIPRVTVSLDGAGPSPFVSLAVAARQPIGVELLPAQPRDSDPRVVTRSQPSVTLGPGRFSDALYVALERLPGYEIATSGAVLNIAPAGTTQKTDHFLNRPIGKFEITGVSVRQAIALLRQRMNPTYPAADGAAGSVVSGRGVSESLLMRPVTLSLENPAPRDVLNALVARHGELAWTVSYEGRVPGQPGQIREEDCVIALTALVGNGSFTSRFPPVGGSFATPPPARATLPPPAPGTPRVTVDLPLTSRGLTMALDRLSMATRTPVGIETISPLPPGLPPPPTSPSSAYYDLTGLTMQEALDKLTALLPEYSWSLDDGIHHIRPRSLAQARNLPLDKPVDRFSRSFANVQAALTGVREIFQTPLGAGVGMAMGLSGSSSGFGTPERVNESRERPISVDLTNVTVRQILDAIVRRHGDISWTVEYVDANGTYPQFQLHFTGFDGWSSGTTVLIR